MGGLGRGLRRRRARRSIALTARQFQKIVFDGVGDGNRVAIAPLEDMIADRMGQHTSTPSRAPDMLGQAVKLLQLAEKLDDAYLDRRIRQETLDEFGLAYLKARCS